MMNSYKKIAQSVPQGLFQPKKLFAVDCSSLGGWPESL